MHGWWMDSNAGNFGQFTAISSKTEWSNSVKFHHEGLMYIEYDLYVHTVLKTWKLWCCICRGRCWGKYVGNYRHSKGITTKAVDNVKGFCNNNLRKLFHSVLDTCALIQINESPIVCITRCLELINCGAEFIIYLTILNLKWRTLQVIKISVLIEQSNPDRKSSRYAGKNISADLFI